MVRVLPRVRQTKCSVEDRSDTEKEKFCFQVSRLSLPCAVFGPGCFVSRAALCFHVKCGVSQFNSPQKSFVVSAESAPEKKGPAPTL
jgi:hypothetical protein